MDAAGLTQREGRCRTHCRLGVAEQLSEMLRRCGILNGGECPRGFLPIKNVFVIKKTIKAVARASILEVVDLDYDVIAEGVDLCAGLFATHDGNE